MAPTWFDKNLHPDTHEETLKILNKLRTRKLKSRSSDELVNFFAKLNAENVHKVSKNVGSTPGILHNHQVTYGPLPSCPPGSWWGIRMDLSRDHIHKPFNNNMDEGSFGAASLCTPHTNPNHDLDLGDYLTFTSTEYIESTLSTHPLVRSCQNQVPIRLVRGYNLTNKFAPKTGYRYDGLYLVISFWFVGTLTSKKTLRFALARVDHQETSPWQSSGTEILYNNKKTRNKSRVPQRCHMDCCKSKETSNLVSKDTTKVSQTMSFNKLTIIPPMIPLDKQSKESSIVMRHVSKKCESVPGVESPRLNHSPKSTCKLQNTNISIRTDLYDSSPNPQDVKKIPMTFCRIYKSSKPQVKAISLTGVLNLNTFGPGARDKIQESQIQMRSSFKTASPELNSSSSENQLSLRNISSASEASSELTNTELKDKDKTDKTVGLESIQAPGAIGDSRRSSDSSAESMLKKHKIQSSVVSMESMTPDQMVDLIVQQRHRTARNLLIGRIIGDPMLPTPGQSTEPEETDVTDSNIPQTTPKSSKRVKNSTSKTLYSLRSSSGGKKLTTESKNMIKRSVIKKSKAPEKKTRENVSKNLKSTKSTVKPFSKSSKKRQSELAKLAIDANFVTKIRGPRTRRFPYAMRGFSKRRDNLRHLKGRTKPDLSKKTKLIKRSNKNESKPSRIPQNRPRNSRKSSETIEHSSLEQRKSSKSSLTAGNKLLENKKLEKGTQRRQVKKSKMMDIGTQCSLQQDASTSVDLEEINHHAGGDKIVQSKWVSLDDVKSETDDSDNDLEEIIYCDSSVQTQEALLRPNFGRFGGEHSAFVPVNMSDVNFRVARLRAIGFKPIDPCEHYESHAFSEYRQGSSKGSGALVARRDVDEQFKKYTTEENNIVGYMDDELRYQDIEEERSAPSKRLLRGQTDQRGKEMVNGKRSEVKPRILRRKRKGQVVEELEEEEEAWHGWKKFAQL